MGIHYFEANIYRYGDKYKAIYMKRYQADELHVKKEFEKEPPLEDGKLKNNISRAKSRILALGLCNQWDFFCTFTLDKQKYDRSDLKAWQKDFAQWIRNNRRITDQDFKYILIPEPHKDGAWHMHGLVRGYDWDSLSRFDPEVHPVKLVRKGYRYHPGILKRFGFNSYGKIKNQEAVTRYLLKYITKSMAEVNMELGNHLFYASQGLNSPELVANGCTPWVLTECDFHNDFIHTGWIHESEVNYVTRRLL